VLQGQKMCSLRLWPNKFICI